MSVINLTLQNRITALLIISAILFVAIFTFIQVNNQAANLVRFSSYQANLSNIIVKNNLDAITQHAQAEGEFPKHLQNGLEELRRLNVIQDAVIFDPEGKIIASTDSAAVGETVRYKDINMLQKLDYASTSGEWFVSEPDKIKKLLNAYIGLKTDPAAGIAYIIKISHQLGNIQQVLSEVYGPVIFTAIMVILMNIMLGFSLSKTIVGPVKMLNQVTKIIANGDLTIRTSINTNDELQELGETFNYMTEQLVKMKERAENANPLTKLPGNIVILEQVEKRIKNNQKFTVIYCDLDNFKAFNDKYGIAKGDEAIKLTAQIFKEAIQNCGNPDDFVGHEGGDDFILLTDRAKADLIADYIIKEFDQRVRKLYNQDDLERGYIIAHARDNTVKQFPIMSISLAGVTNEHRPINSYAEVTNIAAELKKKAKATEGSIFVIDKRAT